MPNQDRAGCLGDTHTAGDKAADQGCRKHAPAVSSYPMGCTDPPCGGAQLGLRFFGT